MSGDSPLAGSSGAIVRSRTTESSLNQEKEKDIKDTKLNPKMSKALSTSAKRLICYYYYLVIFFCLFRYLFICFTFFLSDEFILTEFKKN